MTTCVIQIGNSDDKLTQLQWHNFVRFTEALVNVNSRAIHFSGFSRPDADWQNACWVAEVEPSAVDGLKARLGAIAKEFNQDSIALTVGETVFVG